MRSEMEKRRDGMMCVGGGKCINVEIDEGEGKTMERDGETVAGAFIG